MPEQLPKGWVKTTLGEVCLPVETIQPADTPGVEYTYFDIGGIDNKTNRIAETKTVTGRTAPSRARQALHKDDILFSTVRTYLRGIARIDHDFPNPLASTGFAVVRAAEGVSPQFLLFQLLSEDFLGPLNAIQSGTSCPAVHARDVFAQPILLPPTSEQERIVSKLTIALSGVERAEAAAHRAQERVQRYRAAVLHAAVTGELTRAWRQAQRKNAKAGAGTGQALLHRLLTARRARWEETESRRLRAAGKDTENDIWKSRYPEPISPNYSELPEAPEGWFWVSVDQVASGEPGAIQSGPFGSQLLHSEFVDEGILAIGIDNILDGTFSLGLQHRITPQKYERLRKFTARPLDVVVTVMATVGRVCVLPVNLEPAIITKHCYRITPAKDWVEPYYLSFVLRADAPTRQHIFGHVRGQTRPGINGTILKAAPLGLPPVAEQLEIIHEVEGRLLAADHLAARLDQQLTRARDARQLLLCDAVAGRLVPQDPTDEPASVLLDRIRAAREAEIHKSKGKGMPRPKTKLKSLGRRNLLTILKESGGPMTPEELFRLSGHSQESVDEFFAELRELTTAPAKIVEERLGIEATLLRAVP